MVEGRRKVGSIRICGRVVVLMINLLGLWICAVDSSIYFFDSWINFADYLC